MARQTPGPPDRPTPGLGSGRHERIRELLVPYAAALLEPAEEKRVRSHLAHCAACTEDYRRLLDRPPEIHADHIPAGIIARWSLECEQLQGFERAMVARHLAHCDSCRADLALLGHAQAWPDYPARTAPSPERLTTEMARRLLPALLPEPRSRNRLVWLTMSSGWALAAALSVAMLRHPLSVEIAQIPGLAAPVTAPAIEVVVHDPGVPVLLADSGAPARESRGQSDVPPPPRPQNAIDARARNWSTSRPASNAAARRGMNFLEAISLGTLDSPTKGGNGERSVIDGACPRTGWPLTLCWNASKFREAADTTVLVDIKGPDRFQRTWQTTSVALTDNSALQVLPVNDGFAPGLYTIRFVKTPSGSDAAPETLQVGLRLRRPSAE